MTDEHLLHLLKILTTPEGLGLRLLGAVGDRPGLSSGELASALAMRRNQVSTALQVLLASGLLLRTRRRVRPGNAVEWRLSDHGELVLRMLRRIRRVEGLALEGRRAQAGR